MKDSRSIEHHTTHQKNSVAIPRYHVDRMPCDPQQLLLQLGIQVCGMKNHIKRIKYALDHDKLSLTGRWSTITIRNVCSDEYSAQETKIRKRSNLCKRKDTKGWLHSDHRCFWWGSDNCYIWYKDMFTVWTLMLL